MHDNIQLLRRRAQQQEEEDKNQPIVVGYTPDRPVEVTVVTYDLL